MKTLCICSVKQLHYICFEFDLDITKLPTAFTSSARPISALALEYLSTGGFAASLSYCTTTIRHVEPVVRASLEGVRIVLCATDIRLPVISDMVRGKSALSRNTSQRRYSAQASRWDSGEIGKHK